MQGKMIIICDFSFRRRVGKFILLSGFLGFCLFSGKSGFFRLALLFGKSFLFGTLLGFQSFGFRLASCFRFRIRHGCFLDRYRQAHSDKVSLCRMVAGNEVFFLDFRTDNQFGFHTVGTDLRRGKVLGFTAQRVAVAVNQQRQPAVKNVRSVALDAFQQTGKFRVIAIPRHVEHVLLRNEPEGVGRVCFLLRNDRKSYRHQPQKQGEKSDFSAHINLNLLSLSSPKVINAIQRPKYYKNFFC